VLLAAGEVEEAVAVTAVLQSNIESNVEVAKPQTFNREVENILGFLTACKLHIQMRMRKVAIKKQI